MITDIVLSCLVLSQYQVQRNTGIVHRVLLEMADSSRFLTSYLLPPDLLALGHSITTISISCPLAEGFSFLNLSSPILMVCSKHCNLLDEGRIDWLI